MNSTTHHVISAVGTTIDVAGVAVIVVGILLVAWHSFRRWQQKVDIRSQYRLSRQGIGRSILLGLELMVAGDIIRTVAIEPTFASVGVLAAIVLIRTFLSWTLERELPHDQAP